VVGRHSVRRHANLGVPLAEVSLEETMGSLIRSVIMEPWANCLKWTSNTRYLTKWNWMHNLRNFAALLVFVLADIE